MEAAQSKAKRANLPITDEYLHALALQALVATNAYEADTREWEKLPAHEQTWTAWKKKFRAAYAAKQRGEKTRDAGEQPFGGAAASTPMRDIPLAGSNQMMDSLAGYLDNIAAAATNTATATGGPLADLAASMVIVVDTNAAQAK